MVTTDPNDPMLTVSFAFPHYKALVQGTPLWRPCVDHHRPLPAHSPFIPLDARIVVGAVAPASPDPIPVVLLPGFGYRMLEWRHPETHEIHWRLERRKSTRAGEPDD